MDSGLRQLLVGRSGQAGRQTHPRHAVNSGGLAGRGNLGGKTRSPICFCWLVSVCRMPVLREFLCRLRVRPRKPSPIRRDPTPLTCKMGTLKLGDFRNISQLGHPRSWVLVEAEGPLAQFLRFWGTTCKQSYLRSLS